MRAKCEQLGCTSCRVPPSTTLAEGLSSTIRRFSAVVYRRRCSEPDRTVVATFAHLFANQLANHPTQGHRLGRRVSPDAYFVANGDAVVLGHVPSV